MSKTCILILENLRSVENTASIFRTAEGFGVSKIILTGTTPAPLDRFGRKRQDFAKVSLGAEKMIEWEYVESKNLQFSIYNLQKRGFKILALEQTPDAVELNKFDKVNKLNKFALIVGNETEGISKETLDISDVIMEIPMKGKKESLNVSVSTGIALFVLI